MTSRTLVPMAQYARMRSLSQNAISKRVSEGSLNVVGPRRLIDVAEADVVLAEHIGGIAAGRSSPGSGRKPQVKKEGEKLTLHEARTEKAREDAFRARIAKEKEEIELKILKGDFVERRSLQAKSFKLGRIVRDAMLNIPDRVAADVAAETDAFKIHSRLTKEIREALTALATGYDDGVDGTA